MRIKIENFRGIKSSVVDFPETGLCRLYGDSESGKSTTFKAIEWVLFGDMKNLSPIGTKKTPVVDLDYCGLNIHREKGILKVNGAELENAQSIINSKFLNANVFNIAGVVKQEMKSCFLTLSPQEKHDLVVDLALSQDDIPVLKEKLNQKIKKITESYDSYNMAIGLKQRDIESLITKVNTFCETQEEFETPNSQDGVDIDNAIESFNKSMSKYYSEIGELNKDISNPLRKFNAEVYFDQIKELEKELSTLSCKEVNVNDIVNKIKKIENQFEIFKKNKEINEKLLTIVEDNSDYDSKLEKLREFYQHTNNLLQEELLGKEVKLCPHCNGKVIIKGGNIVKSEVKPSDDSVITKIKEDLKKLEQKGNEIKLLVNKQKQDIEIKNKLLGSIQECKLTIENFAQIEEMLKDLNEQLIQAKNQEKINEKIKILMDKKDNLVNKLKVSQEEVDKQNFKPVEELRDGVLILENRIQQCEDEIQKLKIKKQEFNNKVNIYNESVKKQEQIKSYKNLVEKIEGEIVDLKVKIDVISKQLEVAKSLDEKIQIATMTAIMSWLENLDEHAKFYLSQFLEENSIIKLTNEKILKNGNVQPKISLDITHRGLPMGIDNFSGGAYNRVVLAYQLGISDVYNLPLLLLDEPLNGVHQSLKRECYELLREASSKKLIIVIDHEVDNDIFDEVVKI